MKSAAIFSLRRDAPAMTNAGRVPAPGDGAEPACEVAAATDAAEAGAARQTDDDASRAPDNASEAQPAPAADPEAPDTAAPPQIGGLGQSLPDDLFLGRFSGDPKPAVAPSPPPPLPDRQGTEMRAETAAELSPEAGQSLEALEAELLAALDPWGSVQYPRPLPERLARPAPNRSAADGREDRPETETAMDAVPDDAESAAPDDAIRQALDDDAQEALPEPPLPASAPAGQDDAAPADGISEPEAETAALPSAANEAAGEGSAGPLLRAAPEPGAGVNDKTGPATALDTADDTNLRRAAEEAADDGSRPHVLQAAPPESAAQSNDDPDAAARAILAADDPPVDPDSLRELVAEIVRDELQGALGDRITRNVRQLVRREIRRALTLQELD